MLCAAPFVDELFGGVPTLGAAEIRAGLDLSYGGVAAAILSVPLFVALFIEAPTLLIAKRIGRRRMAAGGFTVMAGSALAAAASGDAWQLAVALSFAAAAGGIALALVETAIMDAAPDEREVWMTRWTIGGAAGDLAAPGLLAGAAFVGFGWRGSFVAVALIALVAAVSLPRHMADGEHDGLDDRPSILGTLRRAFGNRRLLLWTAGATVCDLLDEILIVVAVLYLREERGMGAVAVTLSIVAVPAGATLGLLLAERLLRRVPPLRYLGCNCVVCAAAIAGLVALPSATAAVAMLGVIGFTAASMWPIATAQAYRALPEQSTTVAAVDSLFMPFNVAMPIAIAAAADAWGLPVAVALLAIQPVTLLALCLSRPRS